MASQIGTADYPGRSSIFKTGDPCNFIVRGPHGLSAPTTSDLRIETIELLRQQNAL